MAIGDGGSGSGQGMLSPGAGGQTVNAGVLSLDNTHVKKIVDSNNRRLALLIFNNGANPASIWPAPGFAINQQGWIIPVATSVEWDWTVNGALCQQEWWGTVVAPGSAQITVIEVLYGGELSTYQR